MNVRITIALAALAVAWTGSPAMAASTGDTLAAKAVVNAKIFSQGEDPYPDHRVAFPDGVTGLPDVTYQILQRYRPMKLDLYLPPASFQGPRPTVIYIHGGGWQSGGPRLSGAFDNWPKVLASIAAHGYVVASVAYRFSGEAPHPAAIQDVKAAIRWLRANGGKYRLDPGRIMVWGGSAGGQLAALAATSCGVAALEPPAGPAGPPRNDKVEQQTAGTAQTDAQSDCVQGAVTWYGIFDFTTKPLGAPEKSYLGCQPSGCTPQQTASASAITYLGPNTPPMLMIAGSEDHTVPPAQSKDFHAAMQAKGLRSELMIIPGVDHSFIGPTPEATRDASRAALARTVDFFDAVIGDRPAR
jgi:acetyl esterase/lipase